jgi:MFS family permease
MGIVPQVNRAAVASLPATGHSAAYWMSAQTALFLLGAAAGGLVFGYLGDRLGRVRAMTFSVLAYSLFTGMAYFATAMWQLAVLRFVASLGMGGEWSLGVALVMEIWPEKRRPLLAGLIGAASNVGIGGIAVATYFYHVTPSSWRWVMLAGAGPALLTLFIRLFVPESRKWQRAVAEHRARPIHEIFRQGLLYKTVLAILFATIALIGTWGSVQWIPQWVDQLTGKSHPEAKAAAQIISGIGAIIGCMIAPLIGNLLGRRWTYFLLCAVSLGLCQWLFRGIDHYGAGMRWLTFLAGGATASFYGWLPLYLPELFPTRVRATGQGLAFNFGRILAAGGTLMTGQLMDHYNHNFARAGADISLIYILGMILIWLAPETSGKPLPE